MSWQLRRLRFEIWCMICVLTSDYVPSCANFSTNICRLRKRNFTATIVEFAGLEFFFSISRTRILRIERPSDILLITNIHFICMTNKVKVLKLQVKHLTVVVQI